MKVYIGADHAGYDLKELLKPSIEKLGHTVTDLGSFALEPFDDYPDFIKPVAEAVALDPQSLGIILGGSGQGEQMAANKVPGVRAALYYGGTLEIVKLAREHNNANVLSLGARFATHEEATDAVVLFLKTAFPGELRHVRRIQKYS